MNLLFIIDAPHALNPKKDSTIALMRTAAQRGDRVSYAELHHLTVEKGAVRVLAHQITLAPPQRAEWMHISSAGELPMTVFDAVLMRKEPPVEENFMMAARLLERAQGEGVPVANSPRALCMQNEKLSILDFPKYIPPTWVGADFAALKRFRQEHGEVVLKPLNGMGGQGIYISAAQDKNLRSVFEMLCGAGSLLMAQAYLPAAREADCRVFAVAGAPLPWMLARLPRADDHRGNLAAGGSPEVRELSAAAREIAETVAPVLAANGVPFAGLDVIGDKLIEINITCPTGLVEASLQSGQDLATPVLQAMVAGAAG